MSTTTKRSAPASAPFALTPKVARTTPIAPPQHAYVYILILTTQQDGYTDVETDVHSVYFGLDAANLAAGRVFFEEYHDCQAEYEDDEEEECHKQGFDSDGCITFNADGLEGGVGEARVKKMSVLDA